jgi:hypothetical protein
VLEADFGGLQERDGVRLAFKGHEGVAGAAVGVHFGPLDMIAQVKAAIRDAGFEVR